MFLLLFDFLKGIVTIDTISVKTFAECPFFQEILIRVYSEFATPFTEGMTRVVFNFYLKKL